LNQGMADQKERLSFDDDDEDDDLIAAACTA
jgi:hypothetical protein